VDQLFGFLGEAQVLRPRAQPGENSVVPGSLDGCRPSEKGLATTGVLGDAAPSIPGAILGIKDGHLARKYQGQI
jgi:hypothetical protein